MLYRFSLPTATCCLLLPRLAPALPTVGEAISNPPPTVIGTNPEWQAIFTGRHYHQALTGALGGLAAGATAAGYPAIGYPSTEYSSTSGYSMSPYSMANPMMGGMSGMMNP
ncbi:hypothetical protein HOY82DRAFT_607239 [Tuber indicum]|nr:hypothetical protein HOY82DRAFT_607239 [Tuber indicum]